MGDLEAATAEFSTLLNIAAAQLPRLSGSDVRVDGRWSRKEILGHLIDSASNNHQRFVRAQLAGAIHSEGYAQNEWVATERFQDRDWNDLVAFWVAYNRHLLHMMSHVPAEHLDAEIQMGDGEPVTLAFVMTDYVSHLKHHLRQIGVHGEIE